MKLIRELNAVPVGFLWGLLLGLAMLLLAFCHPWGFVALVLWILLPRLSRKGV